MSWQGDFYTTDEAAALLGVTTRRVQQMLEQGALTKVARGLVDASSLERYQNSGAGGRTRVWAEHTAWGAVALLSGLPPDWLGSTQMSRLRRTIGTISARDFVTRAKDRAQVVTFQAHPAALERLRDDLVVTDSFDLGQVNDLGYGGVPLTGFSEKDAARRVNGYRPTSGLDELVTYYGLEQHTTGNLTVRATDFDLEIVRTLARSERLILTALDAATASDPRERGLGVAALALALEAWRE